MKDKEFTILAVIVGILGILWWLWEKRKSAQQSATAPAPTADFSNWPMDNVSPENYMPPTLNGLQINIPDQLAGLLSNQYIPLFGFVGIAQGTYYN